MNCKIEILSLFYQNYWKLFKMLKDFANNGMWRVGGKVIRILRSFELRWNSYLFGCTSHFGGQPK